MAAAKSQGFAGQLLSALCAARLQEQNALTIQTGVA
jgi:hypothetical protein